MANNTSITDLAADMRQAERAAKEVIDELRRSQPDGNWFEYQMAIDDTSRAGFDALGNSIRQIERLTSLAKSQQAPNARIQAAAESGEAACSRSPGMNS